MLLTLKIKFGKLGMIILRVTKQWWESYTCTIGT